MWRIGVGDCNFLFFFLAQYVKARKKMGGKILFLKNKNTGYGMKTRKYIKGSGVMTEIVGRRLTPFQTLGMGFGSDILSSHGIVPFLGEGARKKNIARQVKNIL